MSVNKVILIGRLGRDPELRHTPGGGAVCSFTLATSESWTDKQSGQKQEKTEWTQISVWGKMADICNQYLSKGKQVYVEGKLNTTVKENQDGTKTYYTGVIANSVQFLSPKSEGNASTQSDRGPSGTANDFYKDESSGGSNFTADDIPF